MSDSTPDILVVDDDARLGQLLRRYLGDHGFRVTVAASAEEAKGLLSKLEFDLLVLDVMMPGLSGVEMTRELRRTSDVPILLLTAMSEPENRISGLESGADDYLTKPFEPRELVLRLNSILRRRPKAAEPADGDMRFGPFRFDPARGELWRGDAPVKLATAEVSLLRSFARQPNEAVDRLDLADGPDLGPRTVDVQITRLRRKIESDPKFPRYLQTVRGKGYLFRTD